jgi:hypothetical protein
MKNNAKGPPARLPTRDGVCARMAKTDSTGRVSTNSTLQTARRAVPAIVGLPCTRGFLSKLVKASQSKSNQNTPPPPLPHERHRKNRVDTLLQRSRIEPPSARRPGRQAVGRWRFAALLCERPGSSLGRTFINGPAVAAGRVVFALIWRMVVKSLTAPRRSRSVWQFGKQP